MQAIHQHDREIRAAAELYLAVMKKGTDHMRDVDEQIAMAHQHASNARKNNEWNAIFFNSNIYFYIYLAFQLTVKI